MAEKACHVFGSATQVGLTQALGLMRKFSPFIAFLVLAFSTASASDPRQLDAKELARTSSSLIGQFVSVHGCLVNSPHGSYIEPCGSNDWHELTLIYDPHYLVGAAFGDLDIDFSYNVEADFFGQIVERDITFPEPLGKHIFIELISVTNSKPYEP